MLGSCIAELLFRQHPTAREGLLTRMRASLVRKESLSEVARGIELGDLMVLGPGERKSGGRDRDSILADAFEALVGAVYLDGGVEAARAVVERLFRTRLAEIAATVVEKDPKTRLQERLQQRRLALPSYEVHDVQGDAHVQTFTVECRVDEPELRGLGQGPSRRQAEQAAADRVLELLDEVETHDDRRPGR